MLTDLTSSLPFLLLTEIGHNFNLAHSGGLDGRTYTDHTGLMGNPLYSDDTGAMCFNGAKTWQLSSWYDNNKIVINPREGSWFGKVIGIADFANNPEGYPVVIKIETLTTTDQFVTFNRATGINRHNVQADDEVTIIEAGSNGEWYSQSFLKATLLSGEVYTISNWGDAQDLTITVKSIAINSGSFPAFAEISVCLGPCAYPTESPSQVPSTLPSSSPTRFPTQAPTSAPTLSPTPEPTQYTGPVHYKQMGVDIDGTATNAFLGNSVAISKDGSRTAIAASGEDSGRGVIRIFQWNPGSHERVQVGQDIVGNNVNDRLGWSVDMNEDGSRVVIGAPEAHDGDGAMRVYELDDSNTWQLLGDEINAEVGSKGRAGTSVFINASGDIAAFGAPRTNNYFGRVEVFQLVNGQWNPMGQRIDDDEIAASLGGSISVSADGKRIVAGREYGGGNHGSVKIYDYDGSQWQEEHSINGRYYYDKFGGAVDISDDGTRVIVGAPLSDGLRRPRGVFNAGEFQVFEYDGSNWNVLGQKIIGSAKMDKLGEAVSISGDG